MGQIMAMGQIVRRLRQERGMSQRELSERIGISQQIISRWETGSIRSIRSDKLLPLARVFEVDVKVFLNGETGDA